VKTKIPDIVRLVRGMRANDEYFEGLRIKRIRSSDILVDGPILEDAFESAKFQSWKKPTTGLMHLGKLMAKMNK
jgi:hypothetical protein